MNYVLADARYWHGGGAEPRFVEGTKLSILLINPTPDHNFQISFLGYSNYTSAINVSTDLLHWSALTNFPPTNGPLQFPDLGATNYPQRFYRAVWTP